MSKHKIEFTLPANIKFSSLVRRIAEEIFLHIGFTKEWASRLQLVVDELFMNANNYGSKTDDSSIYILFMFDENEVIFRIEDEGKGDKKMTAKELKKAIKKNTDGIDDVTKTSGRGLALITSFWTDSMTVEDGEHGGIVISITKKMAVTAPPISPPIRRVNQESVVSPVPQGTKEEIKLSSKMEAYSLGNEIHPVSAKIKTLSLGSTLVLDCQDLVYVNSIFIGHLASWVNDLQSKQGHLILKNINKQIRDVLDLVGLTKVIYLES